MTGTIISTTPIFQGAGIYRVNIVVMPHPKNGVPMPDIRAGFYVKGEEGIPSVGDDVDLFFHIGDRQWYVAFEGHWYEFITDVL